MARITVEDCMNVVENRFELVVIASKRAKDIACGANLTIERDNDKNAVIALREIAQGLVICEVVRESIVQGLQKRIQFDSHSEHNFDDANVDLDDDLSMEFMNDVAHIRIEDDLIEDGDFSFEEDVNLED
jgi:DNA-directed RNA polymerase subunit omega